MRARARDGGRDPARVLGRRRRGLGAPARRRRGPGAGLAGGRAPAHLRRGHAGPGPARGGALRQRRLPHRGGRPPRGGERVRAGPRHALRAGGVRAAAPGDPGAAGGRGRALRGAVLRRDGAAAAGRPVARRRAALPEPRLPRRHPRGAREHQRDLGRRHQDELRDVPALLPVRVGRAGAGGRQHEGPRLQRQGRGPALAGPAQHPAGRSAGGPLRPRRPARQRVPERGLLRPSPAGRADAGAGRDQP